MSAGDGTDEEVFSLLDDPYARRILVETRADARSAEELSDACEASRSTVYRRVERLQDRDLVEAEQRLDPDGHHYEVYSARLQRVTVEVTPEGFEVELDREETDPADRFTDLYRELTDE